MKRKFILTLLIVLQICACSGGSDSSSPVRECSGERWVGAWAAAPSDADASYTSQNLRLILTPLKGGDTVRILFSNRLSEQPLRISNAYLGKQDSGPTLVAGSNTPLYFSGQTEVVIEQGEAVYCDSVEFSFEAFEKLAVSLYLPGQAPNVTKHHAAMQTSYFSEADSGTLSAEESGDGFTGSTTTRPIVMGVSVMAPAGHSLVVAIGDSITDGDGSGGPDTDNRYPDYLARRLNQQTDSLSVVNLGISGNRILEYGLLSNMGQPLLTRLEADVLARDDVSNVIILEGINDLGIGADVTADDIIQGLQEAVEIIKTKRSDIPQIKVFVGTILPAGGTVDPIGALYRETESRRLQVNEFIRTVGIGDGYIDFAEAVKDPENEALLASDYDSGDGLHPSAKGYEQMALKVDISRLRSWDCSHSGDR